jgi:hypothetical protein
MKAPAFLFKDECIIKPYLGKTPKGQAYANEYFSRCNFDAFKKLFNSVNGESFTSQGKLELPYSIENATLTAGTQIIMDGISYELAAVKGAKSFGISHLECLLK